MLEIYKQKKKILKEQSHVLERKWIFSNILTIYLLCLYFSNQSKFPLLKVNERDNARKDSPQESDCSSDVCL